MRKDSRRRALSALGIGAGAAIFGACIGGPLAPLPLDVNLQASKLTASIGDTIVFQTNAQGNSLFGIAIDFGDTKTTSYDAQGARTLRVTFAHAYDAKGTYLVRVTATDQTLGSKDASLQIAVP